MKQLYKYIYVCTCVYTYRHKQSGKLNSVKLFLLLSRHIWRINRERVSIFYFMLCCACRSVMSSSFRPLGL